MPVNAAAAVLFLAFLFNAFELADAFIGLGVAQPLRGASHLLYALLIIVVLVASYLKARKGAEAAERES
jgi:hypothetical protein